VDSNREVVRWRALLLLCLIAILLRVAVVFYVGVPNIARYSESGITANNLVQGRGYTFDLFGVRKEQPLRSFMPPLFPALLAFCLRYFADPGLTLGLLQALLAGLTILPFYFVGWRLAGDEVVAWLATVAATVYPVTVIMSAYPPSLTLDLFLLSVALWSVVRLAKMPSPGWAVVVGATFGVAALARPMMLGFAPCVILWLALLGVVSPRRLVLLGGVMVAAMLLVLLPWTMRNYWVHRQFVLISTNGGFVFWNGNNPFTTGSGLEVYPDRLARYLGATPDPNQPPIREQFPYPLPVEIEAYAATMDEVALDRAHWQAGLNFIRSTPAQWLALALAKARGFLWFRANIGFKYAETWTKYYQWLYGGLLLVALPGLILSWRRWRHFTLMYLLVAYHFAVYVVFHMQTRYRWVIEPYYLLFAALAVAWLLRRLPAGARIKTLLTAAPHL
jgi:4-amino-4-deoxy-L-arabinose transferase-like glycosyltransferase